MLSFRKETFRMSIQGENKEFISHENGFEKDEYYGFEEPKVEGLKRSHLIWQKYASPVWTDIRQTHVLNATQGREQDDEKHLCPLQIDVIARGIALWSNPGDVVFTPFLGVGSEVYQAVKMGRKGLGIELKSSYFEQSWKCVSSSAELSSLPHWGLIHIFEFLCQMRRVLTYTVFRKFRNSPLHSVLF